MKTNIHLKTSLIFQAFAPLFLLLALKYFPVPIWREPNFYECVIGYFSVAWLLVAIIISIGFNSFNKSGFSSHGETIQIKEAKSSGSFAFLVCYILLLMNNFSERRGIVMFLTMLLMMICYLSVSDVFCQNPVLTVMNYKAFSFTINNPYSDVEAGRSYIGITKGNKIDDSKIIKRKYVAPGVFLIYNDK